MSHMLGLRTVKYVVPDLARAKAWYGEAFGATPYFDEPFYVGFNIGGFELGLDPDLSAQQPGAGGATAYWGVTDAAAALKRLEAMGARAHEPLQDVGDGIKVASVLDPFGNVVGVIENPHFTLGGS
jgi:predicted enzyme related to lactoylglutathione lyase